MAVHHYQMWKDPICNPRDIKYRGFNGRHMQWEDQ